MESKKSQADANTYTTGSRITVTILEAVDEFRRIWKAIQEFSMADPKKINPQRLNPQRLLEAASTEQALKDQEILGDAELSFISALATAARQSSRLSEAPGGQKKGEKLPD